MLLSFHSTKRNELDYTLFLYAICDIEGWKTCLFFSKGGPIKNIKCKPQMGASNQINFQLLQSDIGKDFEYSPHSALPSHSIDWWNKWIVFIPFFSWIVKSKQSLISKDHYSTNAHCLFTGNLPHPSFFFQITGSICHLLASTWTNCKFFFLIWKTSFQKKGNFQPVAEHRFDFCSSAPSECEQGKNIFPFRAKEQSDKNTLPFLCEYGRGICTQTLFRCLNIPHQNERISLQN